MTLAEYDFRKPPPGDVERNVSAWLALAARRSTEAAGALKCPLTVDLAKVESTSASVVLGSFPEGAVGVPLVPPGDPAGGAMLVIPNPVLIALLSGLLGEPPAELPAGREPTPLEASLVPHLVRELFVGPLQRSWPGAEHLELSVGTPGAPAAGWTGGVEPNVLATLTITAPFGDHPVYLALTRSGRWERLAAAGLPPRVAAVPPEQIEAVVRAMSVELAVVLGRADLSMHDLSSLTPGDVVVFDQKVTQPLDGLVSGARKFRVWPGAVGDRAAVVVENVTGD